MPVSEPARSISRLGFRRWYERQLFESFAWLTTCLLCGVAFAAILEFVGLRTPGLTPLLTITVLYFVGLIGVTAWRTFWSRLSRAQGYADGATCRRCDTYGLFEVMGEARSIPVRCRRCGHEWTIAAGRGAGGDAGRGAR